MLRKSLALCVLFVLCLAPAFAQGQSELARAKQAMESGDYRAAIDQFRSLANSQSISREIRQESAYFIGFCYVKLRDAWSAIEAFENFLRAFDKGTDPRFVPDALYVLGRNYEEVKNVREAVRVYRSCLDRFPNNPFAGKCRERLDLLGVQGGGHHGGGHHGGGNEHDGITPAIRDIIELAKMQNNTYNRDEMLLKGAQQKARTASDFIELATNISNTYTRDHVLELCAKSEYLSYMSVPNLVTLGQLSKNSYNKDQFLLSIAKKRARTGDDFFRLASAISNAYTIDEVLGVCAKSEFLREMYPEELVKLAQVSKNSYNRDQFLLDMVNKRAVRAAEYILFAEVISNTYTRDQVLEVCLKSEHLPRMRMDELVRLGQLSQNSYNRDQFYLALAKKRAHRMEEFRLLADSCNNSYTKQEILRIAQDHIMNGPSRDMTPGMAGYTGHGTDRRLADSAPEQAVSDPFAGTSYDPHQVERVSAFLEAVRTKTDVREKARQLTRDDMSLDSVRKSWKTYSDMEKFHSIHGAD